MLIRTENEKVEKETHREGTISSEAKGLRSLAEALDATHHGLEYCRDSDS